MLVTVTVGDGLILRVLVIMTVTVASVLGHADSELILEQVDTVLVTVLVTVPDAVLVTVLVTVTVGDELIPRVAGCDRVT